MYEPYAEMITGFPLFQGLTLHGAQMLLKCGEVKEYSPGAVLFKEGDSPTVVLLVLTGKMQVFVERQRGDLVLTDAGPGTILGELAVLCGIPRSASVRANEKSARSCNGAPRLFATDSCAIPSCRSGYLENRCAP